MYNIASCLLFPIFDIRHESIAENRLYTSNYIDIVIPAGVDYIRINAVITFDQKDQNVTVGMLIPVAPGEVFTISLRQNSGSDLYFNWGSSSSAISCEFYAN